MKILFQTFNNKYINNQKTQENKNTFFGFNSPSATNPFAPLARDTVQISFGAKHCTTQNFQIKTKIENLRCPACGLIMLTDKQIGSFVNDIGYKTGQSLADTLEKYEDESVMTGKPSQDATGHGIYRPIKKQVVDIYKKLAVENPDMNLLQLTRLQAESCLDDLIEKQMAVIEEIQKYIWDNFEPQTRDELLERIDEFVKQIKGEAKNKTFARKKFIYAMKNSIDEYSKRLDVEEIANKMPTSENDVDSFFVKYAHTATSPKIVAERLVNQTIPTAEHLVPKAKGGSDKLSNYICDCADCNSKRGHTDFYDWLETLPGFEDRLQMYIEDVQRAVDRGALSEEYDNYVVSVAETIATISEGEIALVIPETTNPKKKENIMSNRKKEIGKLKERHDDLVNKRNAIRAEILKLREYPNFDEVEDYQEALVSIQTIETKIIDTNARILELRKEISKLQNKVAELEKLKKKAKTPAEQKSAKAEYDSKTKELEALEDQLKAKESTLLRLKRKQIRLKKQKRIYGQRERFVLKRIEELRVLLNKISEIEEKILKLGDISKEQNLRQSISELDTQISQMQNQNNAILASDGFDARDKSEYDNYRHNCDMITAAKAMLADKSYKKKGVNTALAREIVEYALDSLTDVTKAQEKQDNVIFFLNLGKITRFEERKQEQESKLKAFLEEKEEIAVLEAEVKELSEGREVDAIQEEFAKMIEEKRIIDEICKIKDKKATLDELGRIIKKNEAVFAKLQDYQHLTNNQYLELINVIEVDDVDLN